MQAYITIWIGISPPVLPTRPTAQLGVFDNAAFIGPLIGGITNIIFVSFFISSFGPVSVRVLIFFGQSNSDPTRELTSTLSSPLQHSVPASAPFLA
jgi:hypothetical protein